MSTTRSNNSAPRTYFEQQRANLINDVAVNLEHVLQNINLLNRSLESVIAVGNEFSQVEGLWSQFENVMAQQPQQGQPQQGQPQGQTQSQAQSQTETTREQERGV